jgi:folate-binding protein YgfZ
MAKTFGDIQQEISTVRRNAGLIDLSFGGAIKIGGKEGSQFLQGLVTNDVKTLNSGSGVRAAFLTGKGKVMGVCRVLGLGDGEFLILTEPTTHDRIYQYIFPMTYAGDFKVEDLTDQFRVVSVQGPKSLLVMKETCFEPGPRLDEHQWIQTSMAGQQVTVVRAAHTGEIGYDVLASTSSLIDIWDFIILKGAFHSIAPVGHEALDVLRIEAGIPLYGQDFDERNMMLETNLDDAVSFTKGCYTGQEAVAMATYRGHVSKRVAGLRLQGDIQPEIGDKVIKDESEIGTVTSVTFSPTLNSTIALATLKYGYFDKSISVSVVSISGSLSADVVQLPFYTAT